MQRYSDFAPTPFDPKGLRAGSMGHGDDCDRSNWLVAPVSQTRDSGPLAASNYAALLAELEEIDPSGDDHEEHRFRHWGPGWFEIILVRPDSACAHAAEEAERSLEDYPVLDEGDCSAREHEEACEAWEYTSMRDRIRILARHRLSIFAARRNEIPQGLPYYDDFYTPQG